MLRLLIDRNESALFYDKLLQVVEEAVSVRCIDTSAEQGYRQEDKFFFILSGQIGDRKQDFQRDAVWIGEGPSVFLDLGDLGCLDDIQDL